MDKEKHLKIPTKEQVYLSLLKYVPAIPLIVGAIADYEGDHAPILTLAGGATTLMTYLATGGPRTALELHPIQNPETEAQNAYKPQK